jgi:hypothetical protein
MGLRIGIIFNCQHESLAIALQALLPSSEVISFELCRVQNDIPGTDRIAAELNSCDHVISLDIGAGRGPLATRQLSTTARRFHLIPAFAFGGFHPDSISVQLDGVPVGGAAGGYHSRIVVAGHVAGLAPEEIADLFNALVYGRLGYFDAMGEHSTLLLEKYAAYGIDLTAPLARWMADGCFMHSINHPKMLVFLDLARIACAMMGVTPEANPHLMSLRDPLAAFPTLPFLPELAARHGMRPDGVFRNTLPSRPLTTLEFAEASIKSLLRVPLSCLRAAEGVTEALARLGLPRRPAAPPPQTQGSTALLSWHGTIVRADTLSALLVHEPLWPENPDCADFTLTPQPSTEGPATAEALGGVELVPGPVPGTISVRRNGRFLTVEPNRLSVPLNRPHAQIWERFLALPTAEIAALRDILGHDWQIAGEDRLVPAAIIRIADNFTLDCGLFTADLTQHRPVKLPDGTGYTLHTSPGPRTLHRLPHGQTIREYALRPRPKAAFPNEAGSLPEFRTTATASFVVNSGEEILHPPLTMCDADARWLHEKYYVQQPLPIGRHHFHAKLHRMANKAVLTGRRLEGVVLDRQGVFKDPGLFNKQKDALLPPGLRTEAGTILLAEEAWRTAPIIEGPVCVFINPNLQNYYHFLIESVLPLHIMEPCLPSGTRLLMPATIAAMQESGTPPLDHAGLLAACGLGHIPTIQADAPITRLTDAIWMNETILAVMPAAQLRAFRDRVAALHPAPTGPRQRLYVQRRRLRDVPPRPELDRFLATHDFTPVILEDLTPEAQIRLFQNADTVIAPHGAGLANLLFCPPGTRVLEISPSCEFRPFFWMIAEKLGLPYAVLPCSTKGNSFNGQLQVELPRLKSLFRMLRFFATT